MSVVPFRDPRGNGQLRLPEPKTIAGRVPPHDTEAEQAVLSAVLSDMAALPRVRMLVDAQDFYSEQNQLIMQAVYALDDARAKIDYVTVNSWLRDRQLVQRAGGIAYLAQLVDATPAVAHVADHARKVARHARVRRAISRVQIAGADGYGDIGEDERKWILEQSEHLFKIGTERPESAPITGGDAAREAAIGIIAAAERGDAITGFPTGLSKLDKITAGLHPGDLWIVSARKKGQNQSMQTTGSGKTSLAVNTVALNVALSGAGVLVFSLEDGRKRLGSRLIASVGRVNASLLRRPKAMKMEHIAAIGRAVDLIAKLPIRINDSKEIGIHGIRAYVKQVKREMADAKVTLDEGSVVPGPPLKLVIIDNAQLVNWQEGMADRSTEAQGLSVFAKKSIAMAEEEALSVFLLTQMNGEGQPKGCKALAEHAQVWLELRRDNPRAPGEENEDGIREVEPEEAFFALRKQRDGADDEVAPCWWHGQYLRVTEEQYEI